MGFLVGLLIGKSDFGFPPDSPKLSVVFKIMLGIGTHALCVFMYVDFVFTIGKLQKL